MMYIFKLLIVFSLVYKIFLEETEEKNMTLTANIKFSFHVIRNGSDMYNMHIATCIFRTSFSLSQALRF